jgi:hypothetical protein
MKVTFIASIAGAEFSYKPGDQAVLDPKIARAWIASELCVSAEPAEPKPVDPKPSKKK